MDRRSAPTAKLPRATDLMEYDDLVSILENAGLSPYQADAYVTVLELGASPATEIVDACGVPDPRIYDVLRDLEDRGYIETYEQGSLHARAHDVESVLEDLRSRAEQLSEAAEDIEKRWERPELEDTDVRIVKRFDTVLEQTAEAIRSASNQVQISVSPSQYETLRPALADARRNDVNVKLSIHTAEEGQEELPTPEDVAEVCSEARHREIPSPFLAIVDRSKVCFAPHAGSINEYGIIVEDRTHAYVFHWFFLSCLWDVWDPLYAADRDDLPRTFSDIRYCIRDITPHLEAGATVRVAVRGIDTRTGDERSFEGDVDDIITTGNLHTDDDVSVAQYAGQATIVVETDDGPIEVGGWGATLEQIEALRIVVTDIDP